MNQQQLAALLDAQQKIIKMIALGDSLEECLVAICVSIEAILNNAKAKSSILLLDGQQLKHGAAPSLPKAYCDAVNGVVIGPSVGSCGTAAFTHKQTIVEDIEHDPLWANYKDLALQFDLKACWSTPIMSSAGNVLGSFAIYYMEPKLPDNDHLQLIDRFTHLSSFAIEKSLASKREKELNLALKHSNEKFSAFTSVMPDLALILSEEGIYADVYGADDLFVVESKQNLIGNSVSNVLPELLSQEVIEIIKRVIDTNQVEIFEYQVDTQKGQCTFEGRIAPVNAYLRDDPAKRHVLWMARDISERKNAERKIKKLAFYDPLTSLPNRRLLRERLNSLIERARAKKKFGAILYLDLDDFKRINDSLGHSVGDTLLMQVADRLKPLIASTDSLARIGGDEFVILFEMLFADEDQVCTYASSIAQAIIASFKDNFLIQESEYRIGVSIGICLLEGQNMTIDEALKRADTAMYRSKNHGGNYFTFFDPSLQLLLDQRIEIEQSIIASIQANEFCAYFQPQVNLNNELVGAEALIRWMHPEKGLVSPMDFIPVAEQLGLIHKLQRIVLQDACRLINALEQAKLLKENFQIAINISAVQFKNPHMKTEIMTTLEEFNVSPERIKLEITESMLIDDIEQTISKMHSFRAEGFVFSIDDFGTGYSSLTYLNTFPVDELKIDKSFVDNIHLDKVGMGIVDAIIALSEHMEFNVVAEGVELEAQLNLLKNRKIKAIQGYYFSKPLPFDAFVTWLKSHDKV